MALISIKQYRDFWDFPRIFLIEHKNSSILFDCKFDERKEDYRNTFRVFLMPKLNEHELEGSWVDLSKRAIKFLGEVLTIDVTFDESRREFIEDDVLMKLLAF